MPLSSILLAPWWQRLRSYNMGVEGHQQFVIPTSARKVSAQWMASTFRIIGLAGTNHDMLRIENAAGSPVLLAVKKLCVEYDSTAVLVTVMPTFKTYKVVSSLATGGVASDKHLFDSADTSNSNCVFAGAASADGTASLITWTTPGGTPGWRQSLMRLHTAVGQVANYEGQNLIPDLCRDDPIILRAGQQLVVTMDIAAAVTSHFWLKGVMEEFTLP